MLKEVEQSKVMVLKTEAKLINCSKPALFETNKLNLMDRVYNQSYFSKNLMLIQPHGFIRQILKRRLRTPLRWAPLAFRIN